jgi:hypothetical protein
MVTLGIIIGLVLIVGGAALGGFIQKKFAFPWK